MSLITEIPTLNGNSGFLLLKSFRNTMNSTISGTVVKTQPIAFVEVCVLNCQLAQAGVQKVLN